MKISTKLCVAAFALAAPLAASAANLSYSFAEFDYVRLSGFGATANGYGLTGDYAFTDSVYGTAGYQHATVLGVSASGYGLGVGYHMPVTSSTDFVVAAEYSRAQGGGVTSTGTDVTLGFRGMATSSVELNAGLDWSHSSGSSSTSYGVGGVFYFTDTLGLAVGYSRDNSSSTNQTLVGIRGTF